MNIKIVLLIFINLIVIPSLIASEAPKKVHLGSKDWLVMFENMAQNSQASAATATAAAPAPASSELNKKHASENLVRRKVIFKQVEKSSYRSYNNCACEFVATVDYDGTNNEVVEDFYKQKIPLALWAALQKQIEKGIQCTKTFMYQPPAMFPNKGVIHFPAVRKKCQRIAQAHWTLKELEIEIK